MKGGRIVASTAAALMLMSGASMMMPPAASAAELSGGCQDANRDGYDTTYQSAMGSRGFLAGETISIGADQPTEGTPQGFRVQIYSGPVFLQGALLEETITYTFQADYANAYIRWTTLPTNEMNFATWTISCSREDLPPASEPTSEPTSVPIPIPPWLQAYGIFHHDDACLDPWTNSWQKWAEPITGGWVCTRSIPSLG